MADILSITQAIVLVAGFGLVVASAFFLKGLYLIRAGEVGVLVKRLGGEKMPAGQRRRPEERKQPPGPRLDHGLSRRAPPAPPQVRATQGRDPAAAVPR